jgi:hypothetical protein
MGVPWETELTWCSSCSGGDMNKIIYIVGLVVVVGLILSWLGFR